MSSSHDIPAVRPGLLHLELDLPAVAAASEVFSAWGFRALFEVEEPERCVALTDGYFTWLLAERQEPPQLCLHYFTDDWDAWFSAASESVRQQAKQEADPEWGVSFEVSDGVHVQVQPALPDAELAHSGLTLLPQARFAEVGVAVADLSAELIRWQRLGFRLVRRSVPPEPDHALLFDGLIVLGLYADAPWRGGALAFYADDPEGRAALAAPWCGPAETLAEGAFRVGLPGGGLTTLWLPEYRKDESPVAYES